MAEAIRLEVKTEEGGRRLDVFLSQRLEPVSRSAIQRWIEAGGVRVEGRRRKANYAVKPGERIVVAPPEPEPLELIPEPIELRIIYEDEAIVVVDKPAGMVVHPGAGNRRGTLANALLHHFGEISREGSIRPGIVHRLDKDTSGVIVVAKDDQSHDFLSRQFKEREVRKSYLALVHGRLERRKGAIEVSLGRHPRARTLISTRSRRLREALTEYEVVRYYRWFTCVRAWPRTGRTHQIRVHFQHAGHPVVGDRTYGRAAERPGDPRLRQAIRSLGRHFLHAESLSFIHPLTRQRVRFEAPLPDELAHFLSALE